MEVRIYDGIRMGRKYDGVVWCIWTIDMACADRIFSVRKFVLLERVTKEKIDVIDVPLDQDAQRITLFLTLTATE